MKTTLILMSAILGGACCALIQKLRLRSYSVIAKKIIETAENRAQTVTIAADEKLREFERKQKILQELQQQQLQLQERQKNEKFERKLSEFHQRQAEFEKREKQFAQKELLLQEAIARVEATIQLNEREREKILNCTQKELKEEIENELKIQFEHSIANECQNRLFKRLHEIDNRAEEEGRRLIIATLSRLTQKQIPETTFEPFLLPSEDIKSKIIGREGRNIRAFEKATGVTVVIEETGVTIFLSSFDPLRRHVAKLALQELVQDGRIHPTRIEELVEKTKKSIDSHLIKIGHEAALQVHVEDLSVEFLRLLGKLKFRNSLGQNMLEHAIEVSHIMGLLAAELNLDEAKARRIGLLHDIGKVLPAEVGRSHALAGYHFSLQQGESKEIASGIGCHHDEMESLCAEGALCKTADSLSAARIGARTESTEKYFYHLENLEKIAKESFGVESAFALQAGKELRVFVQSENIDDLQAQSLAYSLARKIENTQAYTGKIQITVIREKKIIDYAN